MAISTLIEIAVRALPVIFPYINLIQLKAFINEIKLSSGVMVSLVIFIDLFFSFRAEKREKKLGQIEQLNKEMFDKIRVQVSKVTQTKE